MTLDNNAPAADKTRDLVDRVGRALKHERQYAEAVRAAAECVVPSLADCAIAFARCGGMHNYIEVAHTDTDKVWHPPGREVLLDAGNALRQIVSRRGTRQSWWVPSIQSDGSHCLVDHPAIRRLLEVLEAQSLVVVSLRAGGRLHGVLVLLRTNPTNPFNASEVAAAQIIGRRAAVAIEAAEVSEGISSDAARRARLDDALRKWTRVFRVAGWGAAIVDGHDYRIDAANPAFAQMHGWEDPETLTGRPFAELLAAKHAGEPATWRATAGTRATYESTHVRVDGTMFPVLVNVTHLGDDGGMDAYVVTVQDLTALKRAEERLHRAQRMEAVGRLAGGVAHEVSNMITIVLGFSDILGSKLLSEDQQHDVEEIRKAAARAGNITRQLLAFSRQQVLQPVPLRLNDVVAELMPMLRLMLPANIRLEAALAPVGGTIQADRAQLEQVLINLAFNARDAMPDSGTIRLTTEFRYLDAAAGLRLIGIPITPGRYGLLSVADTGAGMDQATLAQIFEPFFTTKPMGQGTGLGLATVYGIVKQSGGYVWAESTVSQGTTVTACLPEIQRSTPAPFDATKPAASGEASGTILVVEDEEGVRDLTSRVLRHEGYRVLEASTGTAALNFLADPHYSIDLVLTDVVMPDVELSRLDRTVHERRAGVPVLYMSGYPHDDIIQRGLITAAEPFLQKPFTSTELAGRVHELLSASTIARPFAPKPTGNPVSESAS